MLHDFLLPDGHSLFFSPFRTVPVPVFPHVPAVAFPDVLPAAFPLLTARQNEAKAATTRPASQGARSEKSGAEKSQAARPVPAQTVKAETAAEHSTTEKRPGTQAQSAAEKPQGVRQEKQQPDASSLPLPRFDAHSAVDAQTFEPDVFPVCDCCF